jgi:hypothetical protein
MKDAANPASMEIHGPASDGINIQARGDLLKIQFHRSTLSNSPFHFKKPSTRFE